jgi:hypothetical protein
MKLLKSLFLVSFVFSFVACNTLSNVASSDTAANTSGEACGKLLSEMHTDYKLKGKVDLGNTKTLTNVIQLAGYYKTLKANENNSSYKKAFAAGLVTVSNNLITSENAMDVVERILKMDKLSDITSSTASTASSAISVASDLVNLFNSF